MQRTSVQCQKNKQTFFASECNKMFCSLCCRRGTIGQDLSGNRAKGTDHKCTHKQTERSGPVLPQISARDHASASASGSSICSRSIVLSVVVVSQREQRPGNRQPAAAQHLLLAAVGAEAGVGVAEQRGRSGCCCSHLILHSHTIQPISSLLVLHQERSSDCYSRCNQPLRLRPATTENVLFIICV
jgi:hypothetical protein